MKWYRLTAGQEHTQFVRQAAAKLENKVDAVHRGVQVGFFA
jgi:hypothetical protein